MTCGIRLAEAGQKCAIVSQGQSALHLSSGSFDLLGRLPDGQAVTDPLAGIAAAKAGATGHDVDAAARKVIEDAGYGPYFGHSFGHSVGVEIHESPNATPANNKPLPLCAAVSAEPGIYLPGRFGVRIEDVVVLQEGGCQDITLAKKDLLIL